MGYCLLAKRHRSGFIWLLAALLSLNDGAAEQKSRGDVTLEQAAREFFASQRDRHPGDLLSQGEVQRLFVEFKSKGWKIPGEKELLARVLADSDVLVQTLGTADGRKFMRKVSGETLIFDRLDRIARVPGGTQTIRDLVKLPDGDRYAKSKTNRGVPNLLDLLPKDGSGKRRQIKDYNQPTGRIYTVDALIRQLNEGLRKQS